MAITRLNHAVLFVRDADAAADFYRTAFGFEELERPRGMAAVFMRSPTGGNHHDLGLFEVGAQAPGPSRGSVGLYHLAWQIDTIEGLAEMSGRLRELGALTGASDHGVSKSLYGRDPDGNEFEVIPRGRAEPMGVRRRGPVIAASRSSAGRPVRCVVSRPRIASWSDAPGRAVAAPRAPVRRSPCR
jgi:catechol-2,3-dioxygenase